nr:ribosomal protein S10 [Chlorella desiccata (nom. nud.)]
MTQIQLKLKSFDPYYISLATEYINSILNFLDIQETRQVTLPAYIKKFTVLRSPHIDKNSREQFQIKKYKHLLEIYSIEEQQTLLFMDILKDVEFIGIELEIRIKVLEYFS